jgi:hypothetical protein
MVKLKMKKIFLDNNKFIKKNLKIRELFHSEYVYQKRNIDINKLLNRVKADQQSIMKQKIIFFALGILLVGCMGIFVSIT